MPKNTDTAPPGGFRYQAEVLPPDEERALVEHVRGLPLEEFEFHGYVGKRRVLSYGWHYGPSRTEWEHSIPAVDALRYSITFRTLKPGR